ncbi:hypothetical protein J437_LFUL006113 [Ladona fulva]|uniref:Peptidoglycan recognition protein family domain-containing protein n=1 Tax=Ladona fulva TaxID=123851 RepID=A0A8K0P1L4_LADFU|nr:hypothetical protein J437_LFUL006113 [Ladona fulva]
MRRNFSFMMFRSGLGFLAIQLSISMCIANECKKGKLVLSLTGIKNESGNWDLYYDFDMSFCHSTENWKLDFVQDWNSGEKIRFKGSYRGIGVDTNGIQVPEALIRPLSTPKLMDKFETESVAMSETEATKISALPNDLHKKLNRVSEKDLVKETEDEKSLAARDEIRETVMTDGIQYNTTTVTEEVKICSGHKSDDETKMKIFAREEWKALDSRKTFQTFLSPAKFVFVTQTNVICPEAHGCSQALRRMQKVLMDCFGDVYSNFYVDDGGRVYEGLGWSRMRSKDSIYVHFLTDGWKLPSSETFASFALLLWEGMRMDRISEEFELVENKHLTKSFQKELLRWVQWSKKMWIRR